MCPHFLVKINMITVLKIQKWRPLLELLGKVCEHTSCNSGLKWETTKRRDWCWHTQWKVYSSMSLLVPLHPYLNIYALVPLGFPSRDTGLGQWLYEPQFQQASLGRACACPHSNSYAITPTDSWPRSYNPPALWLMPSLKPTKMTRKQI